MDCVVYWLFDEQCVCLWRHGYVGITQHWKRRLSAHRRQLQQQFEYQVLFRGSKAECQQRELQLRPSRDIGWNKYPGGNMARLGARHTQEAKQKMSEAAKRRPPMSEATKEKHRLRMLGTTNKGRVGQKKSPEEIAKIAAGHRGVPESEATRQKLSQRMIGNQHHLGHKHSDQTKEQIRQAKIGVPVHSEEFKQKRAERWTGNTLTKGKPWSAARRLAWLQT